MMRLTTQTCFRPRGGLVPAVVLQARLRRDEGGRGQVVQEARPKTGTNARAVL